MPERKTTGSSERKVVTVLFCDVKGSTTLAEKMDPEEWTEIIDGAFKVLTPPIQRYGGTVARLLGDAVLAFFGAPVAHEDDPERAVRAGLDMLHATDAYRERLVRERGKTFDGFDIRVGINTGLAVIGDVGGGQAIEYTGMGDACERGRAPPIDRATRDDAGLGADAETSPTDLRLGACR
jgi:class 3 adenylate cyclase